MYRVIIIICDDIGICCINFEANCNIYENNLLDDEDNKYIFHGLFSINLSFFLILNFI